VDSVEWVIGTLAPFQSGQILIIVDVSPGLAIGTAIQSTAIIEPITGDANPACNTDTWEVAITGPVDPNDIIVSREELLTTEFPNPPFLEYLIRYQNVGNDTAFNVLIRNNLPGTLDFNSFEFVDASHPVEIDYGNSSRLLGFRFDNILLPDSNVNEPASHGFVRYRIKPQDALMLGDSIVNSAAIYFDFNDPVMTNTAITKVVSLTGVAAPDSEPDILVYPVPAGDILTVVLPQAMQASLTVYDTMGRQAMTGKMTGGRCLLDINALQQGLYLLQVQTAIWTANRTFVKE
jgi:hypothetical protein